MSSPDPVGRRGQNRLAPAPEWVRVSEWRALYLYFRSRQALPLSAAASTSPPAPACTRTGRFPTPNSGDHSNKLRALDRQGPPFAKRACSHLETREIVLSSTPHGGQPYTVQRRRVDAGEREEALGPARRGDFTGTGPELASPQSASLRDAKRMTCRPLCAGCRSTHAWDAGSANLSVCQQHRPQAGTRKDRTTGGSHRPEGERVSAP